MTFTKVNKDPVTVLPYNFPSQLECRNGEMGSSLALCPRHLSSIGALTFSILHELRNLHESSVPEPFFVLMFHPHELTRILLNRFPMVSLSK